MHQETRNRGLRPEDLMKITPVPYGPMRLEIGNGLEVPHLEMTEFGGKDGWSLLTRRAIQEWGWQGDMDGRLLLGLGIGDGRNERLAARIAHQRAEEGIGKEVQGTIGIDTDERKLPLTAYNFGQDSVLRHRLGDLELHHDHAVTFLQQWNNSRPSFDGFAFMCLPQSKQLHVDTDTKSDVIEKSAALQPYMPDWSPWGFELNVATLDKLKLASTPDARALVVLAHRIPKDIHRAAFEDTGWKIEKEKEDIVDQDHDTDIRWMQTLPYDKGNSFYTMHNGELVAISINDAIAIQDQQKEQKKTGDQLSVLKHGLSIYQVRPNGSTSSRFV